MARPFRKGGFLFWILVVGIAACFGLLYAVYQPVNQPAVRDLVITGATVASVVVSVLSLVVAWVSWNHASAATRVVREVKRTAGSHEAIEAVAREHRDIPLSTVEAVSATAFTNIETLIDRNATKLWVSPFFGYDEPGEGAGKTVRKGRS